MDDFFEKFKRKVGGQMSSSSSSSSNLTIESKVEAKPLVSIHYNDPESDDVEMEDVQQFYIARLPYKPLTRPLFENTGEWKLYMLQYWKIPKKAGDEWIASGKTYVGITVDFRNRLLQHNRAKDVTGHSSKKSYIKQCTSADGLLKGENIWLPPLDGNGRGADQTTTMLRENPGGIWMPICFVHGFPASDKSVRRLEYINQNEQDKEAIDVLFGKQYFGGPRQAPKHLDAFTARNLKTSDAIFHLLKCLALSKWSETGASPPVPTTVSLQFASQQFIPKNQIMLKSLLTKQPWLQLVPCPISTSDWCSELLLIPRGF